MSGAPGSARDPIFGPLSVSQKVSRGPKKHPPVYDLIRGLIGIMVGVGKQFLHFCLLWLCGGNPTTELLKN